MRTEKLLNQHEWLRIASQSWDDPLDATHSQRRGGRWNPREAFPALYFNEDVVTARLNLRTFISGWPYEPEDLRDETGPLLVSATLPRNQRVANVHSREGVAAVNFPASYPLDRRGELVPHSKCQPIGQQAKARGLRGIRCRSARAPHGAGRELAWFPATARSRARQRTVLRFERWFWG